MTAEMVPLTRSHGLEASFRRRVVRVHARFSAFLCGSRAFISAAALGGVVAVHV